MSLHRKRLPTVTHKPEETDSPNSPVSNVIKNSLWTVSWFYNEDLLVESEQIITAGDSGVVTLWDPYSTSKKELAALSYSKIPHENIFIHKYKGKATKSQNFFMRDTYTVLDIDLDPKDKRTFYASTAQGAVLKCKTSTILGEPLPFPAHRGAVLGLRHLPALPEVYLTHGADARTFVWVHGVRPPIAQLSTESLEPILSALWSPSHCSVILTLSRSYVCLWDIRRSDLDPMTMLMAQNGSDFTTALFNGSGTVIFIGSNDGTVTTFNLHEMPHPPYLQKNHLLLAFKRILWKNKALYDEVDFILNK